MVVAPISIIQWVETGTSELTSDEVEQISLQCTPLNAEEEVIYYGIVQMMRLSNDIANARGWYTNKVTGESKERNFGEVVALMHSELSEGLEAHRKDTVDDHLPWRPGVEVEFADTLIRIGDTAQAREDDVAGAFIEKCRFNRIRKDHDIANRVADGGKKY